MTFKNDFTKNPYQIKAREEKKKLQQSEPKKINLNAFEWLTDSITKVIMSDINKAGGNSNGN